MECYTMDYKGKTYRYTEVYHKGAGMNVLIGEESLNVALCPDGNYENDYARRIDDLFYGFMPDSEFELDHVIFEIHVNKSID